MIGTTISDCVSMLHARYRGSAFTSSTMIVAFSVGGGAADAAAERNAGVRRRLADERPEHELVAVEQVDADPGVVGHLALQHADGGCHGAPAVAARGSPSSTRSSTAP